MTFLLMSRLGAKCVYWSTVMDAEEHKHRAAIQSDLIETAQRRYREGISPQLRTCLETQDRLSSQPHKSNDCCSVLYDLFWKSKSVQIAWRHVCRVLLQFYFFFFHHSSSVTSCLCYLSTAIFHCLWFCIVSFEHNRPTCRHFTPRSWTFIRAYRNRSKIEREIP